MCVHKLNQAVCLFPFRRALRLVCFPSWSSRLLACECAYAHGGERLCLYPVIPNVEPCTRLRKAELPPYPSHPELAAEGHPLAYTRERQPEPVHMLIRTHPREQAHRR
jgi:hypothetical protein